MINYRLYEKELWWCHYSSVWYDIGALAAADNMLDFYLRDVN